MQRHSQQLAALIEALVPLAIGQEAVVADADETLGQGVHQEAAHELRRLQRHDFVVLTAGVIFVAKAHSSVIQTDQPLIGDGDAVRIARSI